MKCRQVADSVFWCGVGGCAGFGDAESNHLLAVGTGFHVPGRQTRLLLPNTAPEATLAVELFESIKDLQHRFKDRVLVN